MVRAILKKDIKDELLGSQTKLAALAESQKVQFQTMQKHIKQDSPILIQIDVIEFIKELLNKAQITDVYEMVPVGDKHLQHD